ncbi:MAG TPA: hypothetical protein VH637_09615 [Streptosporangiaceae bacterium]|jgi:hypothetical protein
MDAPASRPGDFLPPELMHLLGAARRAIDQHVNDHGSCVACGSSWPCQRARLAEFALGAL